jgi:Lon protease-like protein
MAVELALFPLETVLFPHMPLALHVFEERYRRMMRDCTSGGTSFGVLAVREGSEVGPGAVPYDVGTLALIREAREVPDGRYHLLVAGASRFKVERFSHDRPYPCGTVRYLEDGPVGGDAAGLADAVRGMYRRYLARFRGHTHVPHDDVDLPDEPELLSYVVAASLRVEVVRRQELLELDSAEDRLRACMALLRREQGLADLLLDGTPTAVTASLN